MTEESVLGKWIARAPWRSTELIQRKCFTFYLPAWMLAMLGLAAIAMVALGLAGRRSPEPVKQAAPAAANA